MKKAVDNNPSVPGSGTIVYNDGRTAVELMPMPNKTIQIGTIKAKNSNRAQFMIDLPVNTTYLIEASHPEYQKLVNEWIEEGLRNV